MINYANRPRCHTLSNAFPKSRKTAAVRSFLLADITSSSTRAVSWIEVERPFLNAYCSGLIMEVVAFFKRVRSRISKIFAIEFSNDIGR